MFIALYQSWWYTLSEVLDMLEEDASSLETEVYLTPDDGLQSDDDSDEEL